MGRLSKGDPETQSPAASCRYESTGVNFEADKGRDLSRGGEDGGKNRTSV